MYGVGIASTIVIPAFAGMTENVKSVGIIWVAGNARISNLSVIFYDQKKEIGYVVHASAYGYGTQTLSHTRNPAR